MGYIPEGLGPVPEKHKARRKAAGQELFSELFNVAAIRGKSPRDCCEPIIERAVADVKIATS